MNRLCQLGCLLAEILVMIIFQSHLGHTMPMQLSMFSGAVIMSATYAGSLLIPAAMFLIAIHVAAFGAESLVLIVQRRPFPTAYLLSRLIHLLSLYLQAFSVVLLLYFFKLSLAGRLLGLTSYMFLAVALAELIFECKKIFAHKQS